MSRYDRYDDRSDRGGRYEDRGGRYEDRGAPRHDDRDRRDDRRGGGRYDDHPRGGGRDRDDRRYGDRDRGYGGRDRGYGGRDRGGDRRGGYVPPEQNTRIFIGSLSRRAQYEDVKKTCEKYGRVLNIDIKDGFGFVEFDSPRAAGDAVAGLKDFKFDGEYWNVHYAKGRRPNFPSKGRGEFRIRVEGIDRRTSWQDLKDFARGAGEVVYADVTEDSNGDKVGIIEYLTEGEYESALRKLDGALLDEKKVKLVSERSSGASRENRPRDPSPAPYNDNGRSRSPAAQRSRSPVDNNDSPPRRARSRSPADNGARSRTPEY